MAGQLKVGGNIIASHSGVEGAGEVTLQNVTLGDSAVPSRSMNFRNKIINGNFDIWQRGTSQTSSGFGSADRWQNYHTGSTKTASQQAFPVGQTDVPGNPKYYLRNVVSSVAGSGNRVLVNQKIEGVSTLAGQTATLSFWAKADSNKNIATEFTQYFGSGGSPSSGLASIGVTTHNLTTSWQKFTATVSIPSISGKTIGSDGNDLLDFLFWFDAGSNWNSRNNSLGQQSGTFDIAQVQLEEGAVPTPFEHRPYGTELALCQRYGFRFTGTCGSVVKRSASNYAFCHIHSPQPMRATPEITVNAGGQIVNYDVALDNSLTDFAVVANDSDIDSAMIQYYCIADGVTNGSVVAHQNMDLFFSAEL